MTADSRSIRLKSHWGTGFAVAGAILGGALALLTGPVVGWLLERIDSAPAPLRLIDQLPLLWSLPLLMLAGAAAGYLIYAAWEESVGTVTVNSQSLRLQRKEGAVEFLREEVADAFFDKDELVLLSHDSREMARTSSESGLAKEFATAFAEFGYPFSGTADPRDTEFRPWVDRSSELSEEIHVLLRQRQRALTDQRAGEAQTLRDQLAEHRVVVRDRGESQQIRIAGSDDEGSPPQRP